jgi:archaellum component FlaC
MNIEEIETSIRDLTDEVANLKAYIQHVEKGLAMFDEKLNHLDNQIWNFTSRHRYRH